MIDYKLLQAETVAQCKKYVEAFCEIMGYTEDGYMPEYYFIGSRNPDIFGVVCINDYWYNMSDLCVVIGEYDRWHDKIGDDLPKVIEEWYYYHIDESETWKGYDRHINLQHWLMGARPTEKDTSQEYIKQLEKELEKAYQRLEKAKATLTESIENFKREQSKL